MVLTGGKGKDETIPESEAAKNRLLSYGIAESRIYTEVESTSTEENLKYAAEIIQREGSMDDLVLIVSSSFHLYRARQIAADLGFSAITTLGSRGVAILLPQYYVREYAAHLFSLIN